MACQKCKSEKVIAISAKCNDMFNASDNEGLVKDGYVPRDLGIGGGDYVEFDYCLQCGQMQGEFPIEPSFDDWS